MTAASKQIRRSLRRNRLRRWVVWCGLGLALFGGVLLEGCQALPRSASGEQPPSAATSLAPQVVVESGILQSREGCSFGYDIHRLEGMPAAAQVLVAHGFLRDRSRMRGLANALAEAGFTTVSVDLCNMRPWDGAHRENAADLQLAAQKLGRPGVVYAGFSAGGLAALIAASGDADSVGVVVLDLVDQADLGLRAAVTLRKPVVGLFGEPSQCNAESNGLTVLAEAANAEIEQFVGATHCDFESPTDRLCRWFCEPSSRAADDASRTREQVIAAAVAAVGRLLLPVPAPVDLAGRN